MIQTNMLTYYYRNNERILNMTNISNLENLLRENVVEVTFTKANGETRVMNATLMEDRLPETVGSNTTANDDVITVVDTDLGEWRRFRKDSVNNFTVIE